MIMKWKFLFIITLVTLIVYLVSSPGETPYNYFTRLSESFIRGRLYVTEHPSWMNELIPIADKYFVVYPPMPAVILIPYVFLFGKSVSQSLFSILLGVANVGLIYILLKRIGFSLKTTILVTVLFAFGTNHWFLASVGSAWYMAHITALFFLILALIETFGKQRIFLIGFLLGASFWARTTEMFTLPFFYILFWKKFWPINKRNIFNFLLLNSGMAFFILVDAEYNFLRFGNFSPFSPYQLIPKIDQEPIFQQGFMNLAYIQRHIQAIFFRLPEIRFSPPYLIPSLYSTALWFTTPAIFFALRAKKSLLVTACWAGILSTLFVISLWGGVGFSQFGYRFAQDFMPFLLILIALGIGQKPTKWGYLLVLISILVNLWGTILINKFNLYFI